MWPWYLKQRAVFLHMSFTFSQDERYLTGNGNGNGNSNGNGNGNGSNPLVPCEDTTTTYPCGAFDAVFTCTCDGNDKEMFNFNPANGGKLITIPCVVEGNGNTLELPGDVTMGRIDFNAEDNTFDFKLTGKSTLEIFDGDTVPPGKPVGPTVIYHSGLIEFSGSASSPFKTITKLNGNTVDICAELGA